MFTRSNDNALVVPPNLLKVFFKGAKELLYNLVLGIK
jgi:hypothetical protein